MPETPTQASPEQELEILRSTISILSEKLRQNEVNAALEQASLRAALTEAQQGAQPGA